MIKDGLYYFELFTDHYTRGFQAERILFEGRTQHQEVHCLQNPLLGKALFLDRKIQSAECDEFIYHESLIHPGLISVPRPARVLILGGGEGATLREVLKHTPVETATMVDIDKDLVQICQEHLPEWSDGAFTHSKSKILFEDAKKFVEETREKYDVVVSDLTEPVESGVSIPLFTQEFFQNVKGILAENSLFILQAGSADVMYNQFFSSCFSTLAEIFTVVRPYWAFMVSFGLPWGFIVASDMIDPLALEEKMIQDRIRERGIEPLKYYHARMHASMFSLPLYLEDSMKGARILTDKDPFIWEA